MAESTDNPADEYVDAQRIQVYANTEQGDRIMALQSAKDLLMSPPSVSLFAGTATKSITNGDVFVQDLIELAEYIQTGVRVLDAEYEMPLQPNYPYTDGEFTVFGPGGFHRSDDATVLNLNGVNYVLQDDGGTVPETEPTTEEN